MNNLSSFVISIKKFFPGENEVPFMQFLLKNQLRYFKSALYYVFKKEETIIGFTCIVDYLSQSTTKRLSIFVNPAFAGLGISTQMINFAMTDNEHLKFICTIDSRSSEISSSLESLGYHIKSTAKTFIVKDTDLKDKLPRCTLKTIAKSSKNLISQFEKEFARLDKEMYEDFANTDEELIINDLRRCYDYKNSYLYVKDGRVCGWALTRKPSSSKLFITRLSCIDEHDAFTDFLKDLAFTVFTDFMEIEFDIDEIKDEKHILPTIFNAKPSSIRHTYSNE